MLNTQTLLQTEVPAEGYYTATLPQSPARPIRTFLPEQVQSRYAYPVLVMFHGRGGNEEEVLRLAPLVSRRNYIAVSVRGPESIGNRGDGRAACSWGDNGGSADDSADAAMQAVQMLRLHHNIHSQRVYLVGVNDGAAAAYRAAFALGNRVAGVVAVNGNLPRSQGKIPLFNLEQVRKQRVLICQSTSSSPTQELNVLRDRKLFYAAGAEVAYRRFKSTAAVPPEMLREVNRWIIDQIHAAPAEAGVRDWESGVR